MTQPLTARRPAPAHAGKAGTDKAGTERTGTDKKQADEARRHLEVVAPRGRRALVGPARARVLVGGGALLAVVIAFALVFLHVDMAQRQFQIDHLSTQVSTEQAQYSRLRLQVAQLSAPQQIIATAEGKLGMQQPANVTYLTPSSPVPSNVSAPSGAAPAGDADWPQVKSQLAGSP